MYSILSIIPKILWSHNDDNFELSSEFEIISIFQFRKIFDSEFTRWENVRILCLIFLLRDYFNIPGRHLKSGICTHFYRSFRKSYNLTKWQFQIPFRDRNNNNFPISYDFWFRIPSFTDRGNTWSDITFGGLFWYLMT